MSKKRKKKSIKKVTNLENNQKSKKVLDGVDLVNYQKDNIKEETKEDINLKKDKTQEESKLNLNEHIQTFISILFTIIIFIALILLIVVLYNNYLKKDEKIECDELEVCQNYIKKDYGIKEEEVSNFTKNLRGIIYNIEKFDNEKVTNTDLLNLATYFIWGSEGEYLLCDNTLDPNCLVTKKEMDFIELEKYFKKYLNSEEVKLEFNNNFQEDDETRIYQIDNKVILTFSEFEYETLKHDIIDIEIDEDEVKVIFALSKRIPNTELYSYVGYKNLELKYIDNRFVIKNIKTSLN